MTATDHMGSGRRVRRFARDLLIAFLDTMQPEIPARVARWMPSFLFATSREIRRMERIKGWLR